VPCRHLLCRGSASTNILGRRPCPPHHRGRYLGHAGRQVGGGKESWPPFYLPIWKDPLTYWKGPLTGNQAARCPLNMFGAGASPRYCPVPRVCRFSPPCIQDPQPLGSKRAAPNPVGGRPILSGVTRLCDGRRPDPRQHRVQGCIAGHVEPRCNSGSA
jgi:hypothetical protein